MHNVMALIHSYICHLLFIWSFDPRQKMPAIYRTLDLEIWNGNYKEVIDSRQVVSWSRIFTILLKKQSIALLTFPDLDKNVYISFLFQFSCSEGVVVAEAVWADPGGEVSLPGWSQHQRHLLW